MKEQQFCDEEPGDKTVLKIIASIRLMELGYTVYIPSKKLKYDLIAQKSTEFIRIKVEYLNFLYVKKACKTSVAEITTRAVIPRSYKQAAVSGDLEFIFAIDLSNGYFAVVPVKNTLQKGYINLSEKTQYWKYLNSYVALEEC